MQLTITPGAAFGLRSLRAVMLRCVLVVALATPLALLAVTPVAAISRSTVLSRAQTWIDSPVSYSQSKYHAGYRTDCSGYASMCWQTGGSWTTRSFHSVTTSITVDQLQPGDALLKAGTHIRIFRGWVDDAHTYYVAYEQTSPRTKSSIKSMLADLVNGYVPTRFEHITASAAPRNLVANPSFDVWAALVGTSDQNPVWWDIGASAGVDVTVRRQDHVRSGRNSIELINTSASPSRGTVISQVVTVTPDATYAVAAWARTASDPGLVRLTVTFFNAAGDPLTFARTLGNAWGVCASSFRQLGATIVAPHDAVTASVEVRLSGGTTTEGTQTVAGTSALIDDVSLQRPYSAATTTSDRSTARIGCTAKITARVTVPGSVTPTAAAGQTALIYVKRPGATSWSLWHTVRPSASGAGAVSTSSYAFKRGAKRGTYRFKTVVPAFGDFLGCESGSISVTLK